MLLVHMYLQGLRAIRSNDKTINITKLKCTKKSIIWTSIDVTQTCNGVQTNIAVNSCQIYRNSLKWAPTGCNAIYNIFQTENNRIA